MMGFLLDMKTILITLVAGHVFTLILISAYWRQHKYDATLNTFFAAKCAQGIAWLLLVLRGGIPDIFTISFANSFLFLGACLETITVLKLMKCFTQLTKKLYISLTLLNIIGFHLVILIENVENNRIAFASIGTALLIVLPAYRLIRSKSSTMLMKIMGYLYFFVIISLFVRGLAALLSDRPMGLFTPGIIQSFSFLALYLTMILGNVGFILMLKEQSDQELIRMARYDELTNALNRRTFVLHAKELITSSARQRKPISLLLFDVDYFKQINDQNGHDVGDRVLQSLSTRIYQLITSEQLFGRYGGDEFAIFLSDMDETKSFQFAEKIRQTAFEEKEKLPFRYTLSIGIITIIPNENTSIEALYISCDKALYEAKRNGRDVVFRGRYEEPKADKR